MAQHLAFAQLVAQGPLSAIHVPTQKPGCGEIQIEMRAVGMNPGEQKFLDSRWLEASQYPWIPGSDLAGVVSEVGDGVTKFKKGDRVVSMQMAISKFLTNKVGGLQKYAIASASYTALIPESVSFEEAATVPVTASTALAAFHTLSLPWPTISNSRELKEPILVWGGGSGVGRTSIAFLRLAGFKNIITTAAAKRETELKEIGATTVINHSDSAVIEKLTDALHGSALSKAIDAVAKEGTTESIMQIMKNEGKIARVLPFNGTVEESKAIEIGGIDCTMFHDLSGKHPEYKALGEDIVWPFIKDLLDQGYPFQPQLVVDCSGRGADGVKPIEEAFEMLRTESTDGRKIVIKL
ncbi:chaperonin 10-like protein [Xylogone sp. PMI_703]|nr:chaperonin 10-like protein [Xylogone sp. PMI_703]